MLCTCEQHRSCATHQAFLPDPLALCAGHPDISKFDWAVNIHRDSHASYIGHSYMLTYFAAAENESVGRVKYNMLQKMLLPCGLPPQKTDE